MCLVKAVMLGRGLIGVRKSRRFRNGAAGRIMVRFGEAVMVGQYQSSSGVFGSDMVRRSR